MSDKLIKECIDLRTTALQKCKLIMNSDQQLVNILKVVVDNLTSPENSDEAIKKMSEQELVAKIENYQEVVAKMEALIDTLQTGIKPKKKKNIIDEKKRREIAMGIILNKINKVVNFFKRFINFQ